MLRDLKNRVVTGLYDPKEFEERCARLTETELRIMRAELNRRLDEIAVGKVISASWIPGADWTGTPFQPIYEKVYPGDFEHSAMFFGNLMKDAVIAHEGDWRSIKQPKHRDDPQGVQMTLYWREG